MGSERGYFEKEIGTKKEEMKKYLKLSILISVIMYLLSSFVAWDLTWIKEISNWASHIRFLFVFVVCIQQLFIFAFIKLDEK